MKRRIVATLLLVAILICLGACSSTGSESTFSIHFIDVGQGDAAIIECDGQYMLIDGGDKSAEDKVYEAVKEALASKNKKRIDILALSHLHADHIGGLGKTLDYLSSIGLVISNSKEGNTSTFMDFEGKLLQLGSKIKIPACGDTYQLGRATVEVIDVRDEKNNDSMVLLITYGDTTFLFAGDMEQNQESQICNRYGDDRWDVSLLKVAHHGSDTSTSIRFLSLLMPQYAIISVGANREPDHPSQITLDRLFQADVKQVFRTDQHGDIYLTSNGKDINIETSK